MGIYEYFVFSNVFNGPLEITIVLSYNGHRDAGFTARCELESDELQTMWLPQTSSPCYY